MISVSDFRNGVTFDMDGKVMQIVEFQHVKPGKGAAFVRVKMKNVITGGVTETTFNPNDKYPTAYIERKKMEYSYSDGDLYYFMDMETYEMTPIEKSVLDDSFRFVKENDTCTVMSYKGNVFGVEARSRLRRQHGHQRPETCHPGNRRRGEGAPLYQRRRQDQHRHPHRRISGPFQGLTYNKENHYDTF